MKKYTIYALSVTIMGAFLSACSGGANETTPITPPDTTVQTGYFLDSGVEGLKFSTPTQSGYTSTGGIFHYINGEKISFSMGNLPLGEATAKTIMTPLDIVSGAKDTNNSTVQNILRLLQTVDDDDNPKNGIKLTSEFKDLNLSYALLQLVELKNENEILVALQTVDPTLSTLVSKDQALEHFNAINEQLTKTYIESETFLTFEDELINKSNNDIILVGFTSITQAQCDNNTSFNSTRTETYTTNTLTRVIVENNASQNTIRCTQKFELDSSIQFPHTLYEGKSLYTVFNDNALMTQTSNDCPSSINKLLQSTCTQTIDKNSSLELLNGQTLNYKNHYTVEP